MADLINIGMTPTSGVSFDPATGNFTIGTEAFFEVTSPPGSANEAYLIWKLPLETSTMQVDQGSVGLRPPVPKIEGGSLFRGLEVNPFNTDGLFRIYPAAALVEDPQDLEDFDFDGNLPSLFSHILKAMFSTVVETVGTFSKPIRPGTTHLLIQFLEAGESAPNNMELQLTGRLI